MEWLGIPDNPAGKGWAAGSGYREKLLAILAKTVATEVGTEAGGESDELEALRGKSGDFKQRMIG